MEFLKALQEAQKLGLAKEEFIDIWKIESQFKLAMLDKSKASQEADSVNRQQVKQEEPQVVSSENNHQHFSLDLLRQEFKSDINLNFQHLSKQLSDQQEQHWNQIQYFCKQPSDLQEQHWHQMQLWCKQLLDQHEQHWPQMQNLCKQLLDQHEQHWHQMQHKTDELLKEFRIQLEMLSNLISNKTDSSESSIKLYFMHEIDLLKQDLGRIIKDQIVSNISSPALSEMLLRQKEMTHAKDVSIDHKIPSPRESQSLDNSKLSQISFQYDPTLQNQKHANLSTLSVGSKIKGELETLKSMNGTISAFVSQLSKGESVQDVMVESEPNVPVIGERMRTEVTERDPTKYFSKSKSASTPKLPPLSSLKKKSTNIAGGSIKSTASQIKSSHASLSSSMSSEEFVRDVPELESNTVTAGDHTSADSAAPEPIRFIGQSQSASRSRLSSFSSLKSGSVHSTDGSVFQIHSSHLSRASSVSSTSRLHRYSSYTSLDGFTEPDVSDSLLPQNDQVVMPANEQMMMTADDQIFTITVSDNVKEFMSPFFYSERNLCRVRVGIKIETEGTLSVHLYVSRGMYDDNHKWPLNISGRGTIFNSGSKRFTPIWQLQSRVCQKPLSSEQDIVFKCDICLSTSRSKHTKVTLKQLESKNYVVKQSATFKSVIFAQ